MSDCKYELLEAKLRIKELEHEKLREQMWEYFEKDREYRAWSINAYGPSRKQGFITHKNEWK